MCVRRGVVYALYACVPVCVCDYWLFDSVFQQEFSASYYNSDRLPRTLACKDAVMQTNGFGWSGYNYNTR